MLNVTKLFETRTYSIGQGWFCDIQLDKQNPKCGETYECYLWHDRYGIKMQMFGLPKKQSNRKESYGWEEIEDIVLANVDAAMEDYEDQYMD